jgi:energy-coupling factor transporter ATP-binding protein EcfA2
VVILPDNDEPGHRHADQVAGLLAGVARTLKILELPGLKEKGDASEWLSQGRTMVELAALVEGAPLWSAGSDTRADEHPGAGPKGSQADRLVALADAADMQLFHDELGVGFARVPVGAHKEVWRCHSRGFKRWLAQGFWHTEKRAPRSEALGSALNVIEAMACFEGEEHALNNRVARFEEAIWYDRADPEWGAVKITSAGWELVADPPLLFRRYAHQGAQVTPVRGGSLLELLEFTNLRDGGQRLLLMTYLVSCLIPDIPHPLPLVHGPQGSAKSTLFRMLRRLIDPSAAEILGFPRDAAELTQQLSHHWAPFYDNLGDLPGWVSDLLCRAVTGEGFTKRELYTDDEDVIYRFRRCVGLNGINIAASAPDLLDRCLLFGLEPIADTNRKTEQQIWADFEMARPRLFGAMLDALAEAMARRRYVRLDKVPRMADFAFWGCAIAPALGYGPEEFMAAYQANSELRNEEVLESSPVALLVSELMKERTEWRGTASSLLTELEARAEDNHINTQGPGWPKAAHSLVRKLNTLKPNLAAAGITIERERDRAARDLLLKRRTAKDGCATGTSRLAAIDGASEAADACDACDAFSLPS